MVKRGFAVRIENTEKLSLAHPRHPRLYVDIDVVRTHRDGWAIVNNYANLGKVFRYHFPANVFAGTSEATFSHRLKVLLPRDPTGFLDAVYGDWRKPACRVEYCHGPLNTEVERVPSTLVQRDVA
jgi:hypothetical protein